MSLMDRNSLTITRKLPGYHGERGWVEPSPEPVSINGSIQPYSVGDSLIPLSSGLKSGDVQVVFTTTLLKTAEEHNSTDADRTTIDGLVYVAKDIANWSRNGTSVDHYEVLFAREDKLLALGG